MCRYSVNIISMKKTLLIFLIAGAAVSASAQKLQLGVHVNPLISIPVAGGDNITGNIKQSSAALGFKAGLNLHWQKDWFGLEFSPSYSLRDVQFTHRIIGTGYSTSMRIKAFGLCAEAPLTAKARLFRRDKKSVYDFVAVAGASYEWYKYDGNGVSAGTSSFGTGGSGATGVKADDNVVTYAAGNNSWISAIVGFEVQTHIRRFGDIAYGLAYHMPLTRTANYEVEYTLIQDSQNTVYKGTFNPYLSYIDVKLCYYFWNLNKKG